MKGNDIANDPTGWEPVTYNRRGVAVQAKLKTFLATTGLSARPIRVVMIMEAGKRWSAVFRTDPTVRRQSDP
jgi:hypothetical protein